MLLGEFVRSHSLWVASQSINNYLFTIIIAADLVPPIIIICGIGIKNR